MSDYSPLHLYFLNKPLWGAWSKRWHLHDSSSEEQWGLLEENRTAICHCMLIKFIQGHCMGLKMDVKSINQSQMDYVLHGLCPTAYTGRYRGLKGHGVCMYVCTCVRVCIHMHLCVSVRNEWWWPLAHHIDQESSKRVWDRWPYTNKNSTSITAEPKTKQGWGSSYVQDIWKV